MAESETRTPRRQLLRGGLLRNGRPSPKQPKKKKTPLASLAELLLTVAIAVGLAFLIQAFIVKPYRIPSPSMVPALQPGQRILVNRLSTHPSIGDIVVFHPPEGATPPGGQDAPPICADPNQGPGHRQACDHATSQESSQTFVKRVIAVAGDRLAVRNGVVYVNGKIQKDSYARPCPASEAACNLPGTIVIPRGEYFMMGDNRGDSDDSRYWGPVRQSWIIGTAFFTYWPPDRIGTL
jgi:signal peptidase I